MHHRMRPGLQPHKNERSDGQDNLQAFRPLFFGTPFAPAPLCGRAISQVANPPQHRQIQHRAKRSHDQHGNANRILMPSFRRSVDAACGSQRRKPDRHPNSADSQYRRAQALQEGKHGARPANGAHLLNADPKAAGLYIDRCWSLVLLLGLQWSAPVLRERIGLHPARQPQTKSAHASGQSKYPAGPFIGQRDRCKEFNFQLAPFPCNLSRMPALQECVPQFVRHLRSPEDVV